MPLGQSAEQSKQHTLRELTELRRQKQLAANQSLSGVEAVLDEDILQNHE